MDTKVRIGRVVFGIAALGFLVAAGELRALDNGLARTPPMGWNSCRPRATSFGNDYRPVPTPPWNNWRQRPQGAEPQGGLQHGARPRSRKRLSTPPTGPGSVRPGPVP